MILNEITLYNIGPYEGYNNLLFYNHKENNTVLIGGKNGSGKTTLLNSVRLALYGPLAYGFKTESKAYLNKVKSMLNSNAIKENQKEIKDHEELFQIIISFSMIENFNRIQVSINRNWKVTNHSITEQVTVTKNGIQLSELEKDKFFSLLRTSFPPSLLELCFFDGEEISHLTDEDNLSSYLKVLSSKIFNLDIFQNLEQDLEQYLSKSSKSNEQTKLEEQKSELENELNSQVKTLQDNNEEIDQTKSQLESMKEKYAAIKEDFSLHGGVAYEERTNIQEEISELEGERKHLNEKVKEFIANELPFFIAYPQLYDLVNQLKLEEDYHVSNVLREKITNLPTNQLVRSLGLATNEEKENKLKEMLVEHLTNDQQVNIIHNSSKTEVQQVYALLSDINLSRLEEIFTAIDQNNEWLLKVQALKKKLKDNEESPEFDGMIQQMEEYNRKVVELDEKLGALESQKDNLVNEIEPLNKKYEKVKEDLYNLQKTKSSFVESQKIMNISQKFQKQQLKNKIKDIEYFSSKMFKNLIRKKAFINHIQINPETFGLNILNKDNEYINKDVLSAGEKELLALSIIWGTITASKKELPLILDTLLGRLDNEHKYSIVTKLLPRFGVQNIVLSTDSEIDERLYHDLKGTVANEYTLNYDPMGHKTVIENHFFNLNKKKVEF